MSINFNSMRRPPQGPLARLLTVLVGGLALVVALMSSLIFLAVVAVAGVILWAYFWWKTRALRAQIRQQMQEPGRAQDFRGFPDSTASAGEVIEGEAVRVVDENSRISG